MSTFYFDTSLTGKPKFKDSANAGWQTCVDSSMYINGSTINMSFRRIEGTLYFPINPTIDDVVITGTSAATFSHPQSIDTVFDALNLLFPKANSSSGGTATTDASLLTSGIFPDARASGNIARNFTPTAIKTSAYTAAANELVKTDATSATVPITLPTGQPDKTRVAVKMIAVSGSFTTTIAAGGSAVFNKAGGSTSVSLTLLNQAVTFQYESTGSIWSVISSDVPLSQMDLRYSKLPLNSRLVGFGNSLIAQAYGTGTNQAAFQSIGFLTHVQIYTNNLFYIPVGGNKGVASQTTTQMLARLGAALALNPKITVIEASTNDFTTLTSATSLNNVTMIVNGFLSVGSKVILITVFPRYGTSALSGPNETKRQDVNTGIKALASSDIIVVDPEASLNTTNYYNADGLHLNSTGAAIVGNLVATEVKKIINSNRVSDVLAQDNSFNTNLYMTGTSGTKTNGATGTIPNNYYLDAKSIGATVAGSIVAGNGINSTQVSITGSYSGTTKEVQFFHDQTSSFPTAGDVLEAMGEVEIVTNDPNVLGINVMFVVFSSTFAVLAWGDSFSALDQLQNQMQTNTRYILRTPSIAQAAGTPGEIAIKANIILKDAASPTAINFVMKVHRLGLRKVPSNL